MITLKELSFSYSRKKEVLDRINLEVGSGHICAYWERTVKERLRF